MADEYHVYIGIAAGIFTAVAMLPQLIKIISTKKADDLSWLTLLTLITGLGIWIWYGIEKNDIPIIITNCFSLLVNLLIIVLTLKFKVSNNAGK